MIIVEGPDGAGKSTLVAELCARLDLKQGVRSTADRDLLYQTTVQDSYDALHQAVLGLDPPTIWDRLFYSDPIYAHIVRDEESRFTTAQLEYLHGLVVALRAPVILCLPPVETVVDNVTMTRQMTGVGENIRAIWNAYERMQYQLDWLPGQMIVFDYTIRGNVPRLCSRLREYLHHREERLP